jgi:hypothetical protein
MSTPAPDFTGDPNMVSPGVVGFIAIFLIAAVTVLLVLDMTRRIRRVRYRDEAIQKIAAERESTAQDDAGSDGAADAGDPRPTAPGD